MRLNWWIWWLTVILLYLRTGILANESKELEIGTENTDEINNSTEIIEEPAGPKKAAELNVPRCDSNYDCVHGGVCTKGDDDYGICLCPKACPPMIPARCGYRFHKKSTCLVMDKNYRERFDVSAPSCHNNQCVCPPQFDEVRTSASTAPLRLNTTLMPIKCDKRDLQVTAKAYPSNSVYKGSDVKLFCCINVDPEGFVDAANVFFVQNTTIMREATSHPFKEEYAQKYNEKHYCWELEIKNAQPSDTGSYMCIVSSSAPDIKVNHTLEFEVKAPRMIQKLKVNATEKEAIVTWESDASEGNLMPIDLRLVRRTDSKGQVVFSKDNATSPVVVKDLRAATPYTLFVSGKDGVVPFEFTEHFSTKQKRPHAPKEGDVRLLNSGTSLICEVEWKSPAETNGRIVKYFVSVRGQIRKTGSESSLTPDDFPMASETDKRCANWDGDDLKIGEAGINPIDFSSDFFSCKFGPLKPNRNYSVNVWAENSAGRSIPAVFKKTCLTNYAQPDVVDEPQTLLAVNQSTFGLGFGNPPDDNNGPISCYYVAIVPLPKNVSLDSLQPTNEVVFDSFSKVFANNLRESANDKKRYFAYIAESYGTYPTETIIGDGMGVQGIPPCNVQFLSRYSAEDSELQLGLKYTGFLIVRVDKEEERKDERSRSIGGRFLKKEIDDDRSENPKLIGRKQRQLHLSGPAYGYSGYFKPILLDPENEFSEQGGFGKVMKIVLPIFLFLAMATAAAMFVVHRRRDLIAWCPLSKMLSKDIGDRTLLRQSFGAVPVDDLPSEYVMRHRDSDFVFVQEYESLPHYQLESSSSNRKENLHKNRYNDIRAFDETRVKLEKISGDENSDYINANYITSWNKKKTFIAAQAPVDSTLGDFWRMVWEQESYLVVMVANLTEKNRQQCAKYWPDDAITKYGDIVVQPIESSYYSDYAIRVFDIVHVEQCPVDAGSVEYANVPMIRNSMSFGIHARRITQYHFMNWNDYKAPECSTGMLRFLHILRELPEFHEHPVVIHCSAGVGRTGTFITIDSMFDQCLEEGKANVYEYVAGLRKQRNLMVQSVEQYVFIYKALAEWHMYGYTDLDVDDFEQHYQKLLDTNITDRSAAFNGMSRVNKSSENKCENGLEEEFKKLERSLIGQLPMTFANKEENMLKNRYEAAVPYDKYRVVLSPTIGYSDSTYINASHIKGYFYSYIAAQDPVSDMTVFDFWRMIADQGVATIVMLSNEDDWSPSEKYWPEEEGASTSFQGGRHCVNVTFEREERFQEFSQRTLSFSMKDNSEVAQNQEIVQFAFHSWPGESDVPQSTASILSLISRVLERQSKLIDTGPILVHSRNGSSETGMFICISLLLMRLKAEHRIDVFQTVKGLQNQRTMMFSKLEQYAFCYKAVSDYLSRAPSLR